MITIKMSAALPARDNVAIVHTRPETLIKAVAAHGYTPIPCSVLDIKPTFAPVAEAETYILSSVHAVPFAPKNANILAIGRETQLAAREAGLKCEECYPEASALDPRHLDLLNVLHLGGVDIVPEMRRFLTENGILSCAVYEACKKEELPLALEQALAQGRLRAVLMFSARAAQAFTDLALCATNKDDWQAVEGLALSPRIAAAMKELPYARIRAAGTPDRNAILEMLSDEHPE